MESSICFHFLLVSGVISGPTTLLPGPSPMLLYATTLNLYDVYGSSCNTVDVPAVDLNVGLTGFWPLGTRQK